MRMSRHLGIYAQGKDEVIFNLYNRGVIADAAGGFVSTVGSRTFGTTYISLGDTTSRGVCLARTSNKIKLDKIQALSASLAMSRSNGNLFGYLGYATGGSVTALSGLTAYASATSTVRNMLRLNTSSATGEAYVYIGYESKIGGWGDNQFARFADISTVVDSGVEASGNLYNAGTVHSKLEKFTGTTFGSIVFNSGNITITNNVSLGEFVRSKYPIKMDELSSIKVTWTKNNNPPAYLGWAREGSVVDQDTLGGKVSSNGNATNLSLDVSSVTGYAYVYVGLQPVSGGYGTEPTLTVTKITAS